MNPRWKWALVVIACVSFAIAISYPIRYRLATNSNEANMQRLAAIRNEARQKKATVNTLLSSATRSADTTYHPTPSPVPTGRPEESLESTEPTDRLVPYSHRAGNTPEPQVSPKREKQSSRPPESVTPTPTADRRVRNGALPYPQKDKRELDTSCILPEYQEVYEMNPDLVGWLTIPGTVIDYPVVQSDDSDFYLTHDFSGAENPNGQLILDKQCDPYTPSYHLVISGHSMKNGSMFGGLVNYMNESYWRSRKVVRFDTLNESREYVIFAAFFSADYDLDETGFRYNANIQYRVDAEAWLKEISENRLYETGIETEFGDEFLTLTTCSHVYRKDGRFVVVCRRIREGEQVE